MQPVVFFGSAPISNIVLQKLIDAQVPVVAVVTKPDKPVGRHLNLTPNPVKVLAQKHNLKVLESLDGIASLLAELGRETIPVGLVAAYGKIIPQQVLDKFKGRIYNIHPSLLPKYRGPSPLQQQILDEVTETGVTIFQLDAQMDHGPIVAQEKDRILPDDTTQTLGERLFTKGADLFIKFFLDASIYTLVPQNHTQATYTKLLTRQDGFVPWERFVKDSTASHVSDQLDRLFRAYHPWPGVWSLNIAGRRVNLVALNPLQTREEGAPAK